MEDRIMKDRISLIKQGKERLEEQDFKLPNGEWRPGGEKDYQSYMSIVEQYKQVAESTGDSALFETLCAGLVVGKIAPFKSYLKAGKIRKVRTRKPKPNEHPIIKQFQNLKNTLQEEFTEFLLNSETAKQLTEFSLQYGEEVSPTLYISNANALLKILREIAKNTENTEAEVEEEDEDFFEDVEDVETENEEDVF